MHGVCVCVLQALTTLPSERRRGRARLLLSELRTWLHGAGVPRVVAVLPALPPHARRETEGGEGALRRLGFKTLQDLETLGVRVRCNPVLPCLIKYTLHCTAHCIPMGSAACSLAVHCICSLHSLDD